MTKPIAVPAVSLIDGWQVSKTLGGGGFAVVFLGEKNGIQRALKVARHRETSGDAKQTHARTLREVTSLLMLDHPNIVQPRGFGVAESGHLYLALDYVDGWTLAEWAERKHPTIRELLSVFEKLAGALAYMHRMGVLHRDMKLLNVLIRKSDGEPVIIDFSCATYTLAEDLTEGGLPPGTERYRAPEQFQFMREHRDEPRARYASQVSDEIFALGVMLHELLTDPRPTAHRARFDLNNPALMTPSPRTVNARVPDGVSDLVLSMLSHEPSQRPVDTEALRRELADLRAHPSDAYDVTCHPPSEQRQVEPARGAPLATLAVLPTPVPLERPVALLDRPRRQVWRLAAIAGVVALVVGAGLWSYSGEVVAPATEPHVAASPRPLSPLRSAPPVKASPAMSPPARTPVAPSGPESAAAQKEGSTLKTPPPEAMTQGRTSRASKKSPPAVKCASLSLAAALMAGCPSAQIRPESFTCPTGAIEAMEDHLHWSSGDRFAVQLDDRYGRTDNVWFTPGADVVGIVPKGMDQGHRQWELAPAGTRFYGKAYYLSDKMGREDGPSLVVRYDRVKLPGQDEQPICFVVVSIAQSFSDGKVKARNFNGGRVVDRWP
ncbi:protein kinase [Myxococcus sp. AM001]|nr:protein kinase [Myxococcus sp. AM001]